MLVDFLEAVQLAILTLIIGLVVGYELGRICERLVRASARSRRLCARLRAENIEQVVK